MVYNWARERLRDVRENGRAGVRRTRHDLTEYALTGTLGRLREEYGTPIYEREWDVLIVLDACRFDLMLSVADEYEFIGEVEPFTSVGSHSESWMQRTFTEEYAEEMRSTAYITGNPYSARNLDPADFALLDEVWQYAWDDSELQTVRARSMTDRLIAVAREGVADRIICHYMQPHASFVPAPELQSRDGQRSIWMEIALGRYDADRVLAAYRDNLRYVLDDVALALENLDAERVVITADHGNAIGEWGLYGHPGVPIAALRRVPWVETSATDTGRYQPESSSREGNGDPDTVSERLEALGYIESQRSS